MTAQRHRGDGVAGKTPSPRWRGVKNWPDRRNRLPDPVRKPLHGNEVGQTVSSAKPPGSPFFTASDPQAAMDLRGRTIPALTLGYVLQLKLK
jgi:hypothetical protein